MTQELPNDRERDQQIGDVLEDDDDLDDDDLDDDDLDVDDFDDDDPQRG